MDKNRKKPRSIIPGGIRGKLSGKGSCRAGGVSRMREAEEELLSLEREDSAFFSVPRLTQDSEAGKASAFGARSADNSCFTKNGAPSGALGRAGRTAGAAHTSNGAAGARPSENTGTFPGSHPGRSYAAGVSPSRRMADNGTINHSAAGRTAADRVQSASRRGKTGATAHGIGNGPTGTERVGLPAVQVGKRVAKRSKSLISALLTAPRTRGIVTVALAAVIGVFAIATVAAAAITSQSGIVSEETIDIELRPSESDASALAMSSDNSEADTSSDKNVSVGAVLKSGTGAEGDSAEQTDTETESETEKTPEETSAETAEQTFDVTVTFWYRENLRVNVGRVTVRELLSSNGITLNAAQEQNLNLDAVIDQDMTLSADSVTYTTETEEQTIAYKTEYRNTDSLPEGESRVTQNGVNGSRTVQYTVTYVNGERVGREESSSWISAYPTNEIVSTGVGPNTFIDADGNVREYAYYIDVRATCYYVGGTTASGLPADESVIAVDPSVISLGTRVYVTGAYGDFGERIAADTGGNIIGNTIDVCIDPNNPYAANFGWRDMRVYILK